MKDPLIDNLASRFAGHEAPVDPGTWSAISGKLAVANGSSMSKLLQEKFTGHEAPVDPQVWANISSQLGHGAAAAGAGSAAGWWAAGIAATLITGGLLFYNVNEEAPAATIAEKAQPAATEAITVPVIEQGQEPASAQISVEPTVVQEVKPDPAASAQQNRIVVKPAAKDPVLKEVPSQGAQVTPPAAASKEPATPVTGVVEPVPSPEGEKAVNQALQKVVDNYVTSPIVVVTEKKVPPPSQEEMPSHTVHPAHAEPPTDETAGDAPELPEVVEAPSMAIMIPTAFSPNADGVNDELAVSVRHYQKALVRIFSATTNALVFSADNLDARWNGRMMNTGQPCEPGMYFYALEITDEAGHTSSKGEVVRLFR